MTAVAVDNKVVAKPEAENGESQEKLQKETAVGDLSEVYESFLLKSIEHFSFMGQFCVHKGDRKHA